MTPRPLLYATLDGYALEGGYDRANEPATCFSATIALGRHAGPGDALGLWRDYERVLDLARQLGLDGVRLSAQWARIEPRKGQVDERALKRYGEVVRYANDIGLGVTLALIDTCWPSWLGLEAWLLPWVAPNVIEHARRMATYLSPEHADLIIFADPDRLVEDGYLNATLPPWRRGARADAARVRLQIDNILTQLASDALVGERLVRSSRCVESTSGELFELDAVVDVERLYIRSLVRGVGPTATSAGLISLHEGAWRASASPEILEILKANRP